MTWFCTRHKWEYTRCNLKPDISFDKKKKNDWQFFSANYYESLDNLLADYDFKVKILLKSCWKWMVYAICL